MRLQKYITENADPEEVADIIKNECKYYLFLLKNKQPFLRGLGGSFFDFKRKKTRTNRTPKGTPEKLYPLINDWLEKNGHVRRDNAVMGNSLVGNILGNFAHTLRNVHFMFPRGKFNYTWIRAKDFNIEDKKTGWYPESLYPTLDPDRKIAGEWVFSLADTIDFDDWVVSNKNIDTAWLKGYEIWFSASKYYVMSFSWEKTPTVLRKLKLYKENPNNTSQIMKGKILTFK